MALCHKMVETDMAVVKVRLATETYAESRQRIKMKLADKVASFGGTLGLFTGMSFLSIIEIAFWIAKGANRLIKGYSKK